MKHQFVLVYFESSPYLADNLREAFRETLRTFERTFQSRQSLCVAQLLKLKVTKTTPASTFEKILDILFHTHDADDSGSIDKQEYKGLVRDLLSISKECLSEDISSDWREFVVNEDLLRKIKRAGQGTDDYLFAYSGEVDLKQLQYWFRVQVFEYRDQA